MDLSIFELKNYWLPLIWMFAAGIVLSKMPKKTERLNGRTVERWYWFSALLLVLPLILWAGTRMRFGDTTAYRRKFWAAPTTFQELPMYMEKNSSDWAFYLLLAVCRCLGMNDDILFFLLIATIQLLCVIHTFRRYSGNYWICIFLFVASTDYFSWMFNGMRQFIAAAICFGAFGLLVRKRYWQYAAMVILAAQFHASAYIVLPLSYLILGKALNKKTILLIVCVAASLPVIERFFPFLNVLLEDTQYSGITSDEVWSVDDGTNPIRVLVYSVPALMALVGWRYIRNCKDPMMNMCINSALLTMTIYLVSAVTSGIYVGRIPIYTTFQGYIAMPWIIDQIFEKRTAGIMKFLMICCYCVFYYFQMGMTWGIL